MKQRSLVLLGALCLGGAVGAAEEPVVLTHLTGTVRDADGKPIAGAVVRLRSTEGYCQTRAGTPGSGRGRTDADGKYTVGVFTKKDAQIHVKGVSAEAPGFIRFDEDFFYRVPVLRPGESTELNLSLARGEVLAGTAEEPLSAFERRLGDKPADRSAIFIVRGPSFKQAFATQQGGKFEVWVPKGRYTLELVRNPSLAPVRLEDVPSASRGLKLAVIDPPVSEEVLARAFDVLWQDMDRHYSYFTLKKVDWAALKERYRPKAVTAGTLRKFVLVLEEMLATLHDSHVWIAWPEENVYPYVPPQRPNNYNRQVTLGTLEKITWCGNFAAVGTVKGDGFGAFILTNQPRADRDAVRQAVEHIRSMKDAPGFVVDLRDAGGGNELLAREIARCFCGADAVYAKSKYRNGPGHDEFGPTYDRVLKASEEAFVRPVVCLIGPRSVSSGEGFVQMMKCLPHVTTVGARTRGSSGNPAAFKLPGVDVTVYYSRWVDMMPDGRPIEGVGIAPDVEVNAAPEAYEGKDPTWEKALEVLRKKVIDRKP
jgi:hypothetical protein